VGCRQPGRCAFRRRGSRRHATSVRDIHGVVARQTRTGGMA
jgi:hypothetical protein